MTTDHSREEMSGLPFERDAAVPLNELLIPADPRQLPLLRSDVKSIAKAYQFDPDTAVDLVLAVDEASTMLIPHTPPDSTIRYRFDRAGNALRVRLESTTRESMSFVCTTFGWYILSTLVDTLHLEEHTRPTGVTETVITFDKPFCDIRPISTVHGNT